MASDLEEARESLKAAESIMTRTANDEQAGAWVAIAAGWVSVAAQEGKSHE